MLKILLFILFTAASAGAQTFATGYISVASRPRSGEILYLGSTGNQIGSPCRVLFTNAIIDLPPTPPNVSFSLAHAPTVVDLRDNLSAFIEAISAQCGISAWADDSDQNGIFLRSTVAGAAGSTFGPFAGPGCRSFRVTTLATPAPRPRGAWNPILQLGRGGLWW